MLYYKTIKAQDVKMNDVLLLDDKEIRITRDAICEETDSELLVNLEYNHAYDMQFNINQEVKIIDFAYTSQRVNVIRERKKASNKKVKGIFNSIGICFFAVSIFLFGLIFVIWLVKKIWYIV